jgi:hypothetical protein
LEGRSPHGIIAAQNEGFKIENCKFYNYNWGAAAALGTCSHCYDKKTASPDTWTVDVQ